MAFATFDDPLNQTLFLRPGRAPSPFVELLVELEVLTNPLEIDVEIPEPLVEAEIPAEFSVTVDIDSEFTVTIEQIELVVIVDIIELIVSIEDCDV